MSKEKQKQQKKRILHESEFGAFFGVDFECGPQRRVPIISVQAEHQNVICFCCFAVLVVFSWCSFALNNIQITFSHTCSYTTYTCVAMFRANSNLAFFCCAFACIVCWWCWCWYSCHVQPIFSTEMALNFILHSYSHMPFIVTCS